MTIELSLDPAAGVGLLLLHFGLSLGWHVGSGVTVYEQAVADGESRLHLFRWALLSVLHHYDLGVGLAAVGYALLFGYPDAQTIAGIVLLGLGAGLAYSDREDHPPEGILSHMMSRWRTAGTEQ